jgi:hypothetical protein
MPHQGEGGSRDGRRQRKPPKDNEYRRSVWHPFQVKFVVLKPAPLYLEQGDNST